MRTSLRELQESQRKEIEETWPLLTYHYGITPAELAETPRVIRQMYIKKLPVLIAEEEIRQLQAAMFPQLKTTERRKIIRRLERRMREEAVTQTKPKTTKQMEAQVLGLGIGVKFVNKDGEEVEPPS